MGGGVYLDCEISGDVTCVLRGALRVLLELTGHLLGCEMTGFPASVCEELYGASSTSIGPVTSRSLYFQRFDWQVNWVKQCVVMLLTYCRGRSHDLCPKAALGGLT